MRRFVSAGVSESLREGVPVDFESGDLLVLVGGDGDKLRLAENERRQPTRLLVHLLVTTQHRRLRLVENLNSKLGFEILTGPTQSENGFEIEYLRIGYNIPKGSKILAS